MGNGKFDFFGIDVDYANIKIITGKLVVEKAIFGLLKKEYIIPVLVLKSSIEPLLGNPLTGSEMGQWMATSKMLIEMSLDCEAIEDVMDDGIHAYVFM